MGKVKTLKRHKPTSESDSEDFFGDSQPTQSRSATNKRHAVYVPRFVIIHSEDENQPISSLSPFVVHKIIMGIAGEPKSIKNLRSGDLLIQCAKEAHERNLLKLKEFGGLKCKVSLHNSLNTSKGIVRCPELKNQTNEHILGFMGEQGVTEVRRIFVKRDGVLKPTHTFVLTFNSPILPKECQMGFINCKVEVYVPNPLRCYRCQVFGHHENKCGRQAVCVNCGEAEHDTNGRCDKPAKCVNCSGNHPANSRECTAWLKEKKILKIKYEQNISFQDARKQYEDLNEKTTYASVVKPTTANKSTQTEDKSTQTDQLTSSPPPKPTPRRKSSDRISESQNQKPKHSSPSAKTSLKPGTMEMIKKDLKKKTQEEREKQKNQQKEARRNAADAKASTSSNQFAVLSQSDSEMEDDSVIFTEAAPSLPKGTISRIPTT